MFAKLYESKRGQVLVKLDTSHDHYVPEVRFYFQPREFGVCSAAVSFIDDDDGWDKAEKYFKSIDKKGALEVVEETLRNIAAVK